MTDKFFSDIIVIHYHEKFFAGLPHVFLPMPDKSMFQSGTLIFVFVSSWDIYFDTLFITSCNYCVSKIGIFIAYISVNCG